ncbi:hypothetical protein [Paucibacter sp. KBW04]|uniref:hypothetical protein n=1 Tax=Paucibacter sp. KBW04 TaxID=2153361 RepID=UPI0011CF7BE3|nr:hypothetical protein [Paucibacter sp. KBW04]
MSSYTSFHRLALSLSLMGALPLSSEAAATTAAGGTPQASTRLSEASALPVALSMAAPALLLSSTAKLLVVAVESSAEGTVWVLERASDGARASLRFGKQALGASALAVGSSITVLSTASGFLLTHSGQVLAFVPNEFGRALMHHEAL